MKARTWVALGIIVLLAIGGIGLVASGRSPTRYAATGTGYVAHVVCSCRYVGNRDLASCKTDFEPGMEIVSVSDDPKARVVTAWVPLLAHATASYDPQFGCRLDAPKASRVP